MEKAAAPAGRVVNSVTQAILVSAFVYGIVNSITSVLINQVIDEFQLSGTAQGLVSSSLSAGLMIALMAMPLIQGRIQKMTMIAVSCLIPVAALAIAGVSRAFALFMPAMVITGIGCGWLDNYINSCIVDVHETDSPKYLGLLHGCYGVGSLLAPLLMRSILEYASWRGVMFTCGGLMLIATLFSGRSCLDIKKCGRLPQTEEARLSAKQVSDYLKDRRNMLIMVIVALVVVIQTGILCWIARYMKVAYDAEALSTASITAYWIAATANRFLVSRIRVRPLMLVLLGAVGCALFLGIGIVCGVPMIMCVAMAFLGLSSGHFMPMMFAVCAEGYSGSTSMTSSVLLLVSGVVRVLVPLMMAGISNAISVQAGMAIPAAAGMLAAVCCAITLKMDGKNKLAQ